MSNFFCCCKSLALGIMKEVLQAEYQLSVSPVPLLPPGSACSSSTKLRTCFPILPSHQGRWWFDWANVGRKEHIFKVLLSKCHGICTGFWLPDSTSSSFWGFLTLFPLHTLCSQISNSKTVHQLDRKHRSLISLMWRGAGGLYFTLHFFVAVM